MSILYDTPTTPVFASLYRRKQTKTRVERQSWKAMTRP